VNTLLACMRMLTDYILDTHPQDLHPVVFELVDSNTISLAPLHAIRSAAPSGLVAYAWRHRCTSFNGKSMDLCSSLAAVGRSRICTSYVDRDLLSPLPSLSPRCFGSELGSSLDWHWRDSGENYCQGCFICGKIRCSGGHWLFAIMWGQIAGIEAAVHAVRKAFESGKKGPNQELHGSHFITAGLQDRIYTQYIIYGDYLYE